MTSKIKFARYFPAKHPKEGKETFFVEQILSELIKTQKASTELLKQSFVNIFGLYSEKRHTIQEGNIFKKGDYFFPIIDLNGQEIAFSDKILITNTWNFTIKNYSSFSSKNKCFIDFGSYFVHQDMDLQQSVLSRLAKNEGLSLDDFVAWFDFPNKEFEGQIICWSNDISYF